MAEEDVVKEMEHLLDHENDDLLNLSMRLVLNMSFHSTLRDQIHTTLRPLPKLVKMMKSDEHRIPALCLMYQLSYDEKHRAQFGFTTDLIEHVVAEILKPKSGHEPEPTATALLINLCSNGRTTAAGTQASDRRHCRTTGQSA